MVEMNTNPDILEQTAITLSSDPATLAQAKGSPSAVGGMIINYAREQGRPILMHFDEVGASPSHDLDALRKVAIAVWKKMHEIKQREGADAMPRVYFFVSGKAIEAFRGLAHGASSCGSNFLFLDMLRAEHVKELRMHLQDKDNCEFPLQLRGLDEAAHGDYLDECLVHVTGGPRLLLYTLRALHVLNIALTSRAAIEKRYILRSTTCFPRSPSFLQIFPQLSTQNRMSSNTPFCLHACSSKSNLRWKPMSSLAGS
jgi:hypothetical protein